MISKTTVLSSPTEDENVIKINPISATVTLSGDHISPANENASDDNKFNITQVTEQSKASNIVPELSIAEITTAGKGDEMLNILVNDSFSTNKSGKKRKKGKKGGKDKKPAKAE